jgi:DNA polymerase bacteriophage-type
MPAEFQNMIDLLVNDFAVERELVRLKKEAGEPRPWSDDPVFQKASLCNIRREDDRTTIWVREHLREPNRDHLDVWFLMLVRVLINAPEVLGAITLPLPWDRDRFVAEMAERKARGLRLERAAYTINAPADGRPKYLYIADDILGPLWAARETVRPRSGNSCQSLFERLIAFPGIGPFYAGQVVADTKFTGPLRDASDWWSFVAAGPGSGRFLNVMLGRKPEPPLAGPAFYAAFEQARAAIAPKLDELGLRLSNQDLQNCMCETFKLWRARTTGQMPRRLYNASGETPARPRRRVEPKAPIEAPVVITEPPPPAPHALPELAAARDPNAAHILHHDFETRSHVNLKATGAYRYAADPTTEVTCCAYAVDSEPTQLWTPGDPVPSEFIEAAANPNWTAVAHNDAFERAIAQHVLGPRHGFPTIPIERRRCSMAATLAAALPGKLERVGEALSLPFQKDKEGAKLMLRMSRPLPGGGWIDDPASRERLYLYCRRDVEAERALFRALPPLTDAEQALWALDSKINERGFHTDGALLDAADRVVTAAEDALQAEFRGLTGLDSTNQTARLITWLAEHGCEVTDVQKGTLKHALRRKGLMPEARRAIELRLELAHASAAKVEALLAWRGADSRVRGTLIYHGAATGRWTGRGPQPQNFRRDSEGADEKIAAIMNGGALASPVEAVGDIARAMIVAAPGYRLMVADFSGVESRVLAWISGQETKLAQWCKFDASGALADDPYFGFGRGCGQAEETARAIGKIADLAFGYMGGPGAWKRLAPEDDTSDEATVKRYQNAWRAAHPRTVQFWHSLDRAAIAAVRKPGITFTCRGLRLAGDGKFLRITLPSGRSLSYPFPRLEAGKFGNPMVVFQDTSGGKWGDCRFGQGAYGGLWTENVVQAIARDLLAAAMQRLEAAGYSIVLHVHDEAVCEVPDGFGSLDEFRALVTTVPDWAAGLPVAAKAREGQRFSKADKAGSAGPAEPEDAIGDEPEDYATGEPDAAPQPTSPPPPPPENSAPAAGEHDERARNSPIISTEAPHQESEAAPDDLQDPAATVASSWVTPHVTEVPPGSEEFEAILAALRPADRDLVRPGTAKPNGSGATEAPSTDQELGPYIYRDARGGPHAKVVRTPNGSHRFSQQHWAGTAWHSGMPERKLPYRLPELLAAGPADWVCLCEGEKDAVNVAKLGLTATTNPNGAKGWNSAKLVPYCAHLRRIAILEDNDEAGRERTKRIVETLRILDPAPDIRVVAFPELPEGDDVSDWLAQDRSRGRAELLARIEATGRQINEGVLESVRADEIPMRAICWLWDRRFAIGKIGIIAGLPDEGKGQILCYIAARITRALEWPNGEGRAALGSVIILSAEEDPGDSLAPRLAAAGADLSRVHFVGMVRDRDEKTGQQRRRMFDLVSDLEKLRRKIAEVGNVAAVLIDPISAYLGIGKVDSYRDTDVRSALGPLKDLAEEMRTAIITVMHFNKKVDITNALLRVSNSMAFVGLPRHAYGVIADAENGRKLFVRAKNNDAAEADNQTLAYHFDVRQVGTDPGSGAPIRAPFIVWEPGYVDVTASEAMQAASENKSPGERDNAKNLLRALLSGDREVPVEEIKDAAEGHGIAWRTLRRAADDLKVIVDKDRTTPKGKWFWQLPHEEI